MNLFRRLGKIFCISVLIPIVGISSAVGTYLGIITLITMVAGAAATGIGVPIAIALGALTGIVAVSTISNPLWDKCSYYGQKLDIFFDKYLYGRRFYQEEVEKYYLEPITTGPSESNLLFINLRLVNLRREISIDFSRIDENTRRASITRWEHKLSSLRDEVIQAQTTLTCALGLLRVNKNTREFKSFAPRFKEQHKSLEFEINRQLTDLQTLMTTVEKLQTDVTRLKVHLNPTSQQATSIVTNSIPLSLTSAPNFSNKQQGSEANSKEANYLHTTTTNSTQEYERTSSYSQQRPVRYSFSDKERQPKTSTNPLTNSTHNSLFHNGFWWPINSLKTYFFPSQNKVNSSNQNINSVTPSSIRRTVSSPTL